MKQFIFLAIISLVLTSCNSDPQPINYGQDGCNYCDMTIVDRQHASQLVTSKGKAYKYDAIECMVHALQDEFKNTEMTHYLVADFRQPGVLIDATKASFLVSEKLQSPMGANLSGFLNKEAVKKAQEEFTGDIYSWKEIQEHLKL
ncbi:MAG: nitrous oxide reductase accessory protein NosL [Xanthomarina sp.]